MKWMKKLRLINWHYFRDETLEFGRQTQITGATGAGKSTVVDALQTLFVANQRQIRYNVAAQEESGKRTLITYLRGKIGRLEKSFLREGDFTSYIVAEFRDDKKKENFVVGMVADVYRDDAVDEEYFIISGIGIDDLEFVKPSGHLRNREEFRRYCLNLKGRTVFERNKSGYQKALLARMGQLHERFFPVFTKAMTFKPITNIRDFVYDYILDPRELQLDLMKQNFEIYERYRLELENLKERKEELLRIADQFSRYSRLREVVAEQEYVLRRLKYVKEVEDRDRLEGLVARLKKKIDGLEDRLKLLGEQEEEARRKQQEAYEKWYGHRNKREQERLKDQIKKLEDELVEKTRLLETLRGWIRQELRLLGSLAAWEGNEFWRWEEGEADRLNRAMDLLAGLLSGEISGEDEAVLNRFREAGVFLAELHSRFTKSVGRVEDALKDLGAQEADLRQQIAGLEQKKRPYSPHVLKLKSLLEERLAGRSPVWIFCEEVEIRDEAWRDAVEGYLNTQRFDLLVKPQCFAEALSLYEREKWRHRIEGVGLVDTEKEAKYAGTAHKGSLAGVLQTGNPVIQARVDHLLGRVMMARDEQDLRNYRTAVTRTCMSYNNLVAKQIPKERYEIPYIGGQAIIRQLEIRRRALAEVGARISALQMEKDNLVSWMTGLKDRTSFYIQMSGHLNLPAVIAGLEGARAGLVSELDRLDMSEVDRLWEEYLYWQKRQKELVDGIGDLREEKARCSSDLSAGERELEHRAELVNDARKMWLSWEADYPGYSVDKAEARWREAENQDLSVAVKIANWENNRKGNESRCRNEFMKLRDLRQGYNLRHNYNGDLEAENNDQYQSLLAGIDQVDIPQYQSRVDEALRQSEEEFKAHFVYRLREAIEAARREFNELNYALRHFPFHEDNYVFEVKPSERYRRFYDAVMDPGLIERGSLFETQDEERAGALNELFEILIKGSKEEQDLFTDYRHYLDYDIVVRSHDTRYHFSQVLAEKSGGETQTPFYIAILASFNHLYSSGKTMRLVVFDEAFSKMDVDRIQASLRLIRRMNLQLIAAVPDEKMHHVAPEVTTTLVVNCRGFHSFVDMISRSEMVEEVYETHETAGKPEERLQEQGTLFASAKI
ncbi:MAG: ATPase [Peptococcaceae bacterium]|nr:ATPase [Peptococcaceae bacterium]